MSKMNLAEANRILSDCNQFVIKLKDVHAGTIKMLDETDKERLRIFLDFNKADKLLNLKNYHLEYLEDVAERAGWWTKKVAISYMKDVARLSGYVQWGLSILENKLKS